MKVLYVADNSLETDQVCAELRSTAPHLKLHIVLSQREGIDRLAQSPGDYDLVLADVELADGSGMAILAHIREMGLPLVVVLLADSEDEALAVAALRMGVDGWAIKTGDWLSQLPSILDDAREGFHAERTHRVQSLRVLYAEDSVSDAERMRHHVARVAPHIHLDIVHPIEKVFRRLSDAGQQDYDVLLLSHRWQDADAFDRLSDLRQMRALDISVVLIVEQGDRGVARRAIRLGLVDIVVKSAGYMHRLPMAIENAFHRAQWVRGQAALGESEERYESIIELAPNGIITANLLGVVTSCNPAFLALTDFGRDEIVGKHFTKMPTLRAADIPQYAELFRSVMQSKFANPIEFRWVHKDGRARWGEAYISLLKEGSRVTGFQAIVADTTERRRAEQLFRALNQASLAMEQALTPDEILNVVSATFHRLGMACTVFLADEQQRHLLLKYVSYESKVLRIAERLLGLKDAEFSMLIDCSDAFQRAVRNREAAFVEDAKEATRQLLPRPLKRLAVPLVNLLDITRFITAPLLVEDRVTGMLSVQSADLTREDLPAITAFAHQVAAAWRRAELYEQAQQEIAERRRVVNALRESEERFRNVFDNAPTGIYRTTPDGRILMANPALVRMLGYDSAEELVQLDLERSGYERSVFKQALEPEGQVTGFETVWVKKDGGALSVRENATVVSDGDGNVLYYDGTVEDITEPKRAGQLLRALNLAALAMGNALAPEAIFCAVDEELEKLGFSCMLLPLSEREGALDPGYASSKMPVVQAVENLGLSYEDLGSAMERVAAFREVVWEKRTVFVGDTEDLLRQLLPTPLRGMAKQIARMGGAWKAIAAPLIMQDTVIGVLSVQSKSLRESDVSAITAFAHQVAAAWHRAQLFEQLQGELAERTRIEEALRGSEERFRALVQNSSDVIIILDAGGLVRYVSPSAEHALGYAAQHFVGLSAFQFVHPDDVRLVQEKFAAASKQPGVPVILEFRILHRDGSWISFETITSNLLDVPSVRGIVVNARDTTERRRLESQFRQAQKMEAVGRLAGGVAHDFNNLLTGMQGYTTLTIDRLVSGAVLDAPAVEAILADLVVVQQASERAAALTHQLLAFSRKQVLQPRVLDLNELVKGIKSMLQRLIGEDVECQTSLAPLLGRVIADPVQIEQVIMNLAVNARDAMPRGGKLTIETANVELDPSYVQGHPGSQPGPYVMLAVSDTGTGMDDNVRAHLFEPFFTTKKDGRGTGLGLATVYGIVKQSGGHIWPYSELGHGTTFKVYLPRVGASSEPVARETARAALPRGTETVLLVEDEALVRELARRILERQGYTVLEAAHPQDALALCAQYTAPIHMMLTDVVMPGMGGQELSQRVVLSRPEIKVLYASGYTDEAIVRHGVLDEEVNFVPKPFTPRVLAQKVREVLDET